MLDEQLCPTALSVPRLREKDAECQDTGNASPLQRAGLGAIWGRDSRLEAGEARHRLPSAAVASPAVQPDGAVSVPALPQNQKFNYTWLRLVQHGELCLAPAGVLGAVGLRRCQGRSRSLAWLHGALATAQPGLVSDAAGGVRDGPCLPSAGQGARRALMGAQPGTGAPHLLLPA